ncbi:MAG: AAA family ATPase [Patescibacteria group bacterium]|nr:AAA family ATPase [Patescibacteria group bacterium]MCL5261926.1 AAA family ATPase [Patescibacteria group bacterium]
MPIFDSQEIVVDQTTKSLREGLKIPNNYLNILIGPNNSGKSNILEFINQQYKTDGATASDYIPPRRFDVSNNMQSMADTYKELEASLNQRRRVKDSSTSELPNFDPIRELAALDNSARSALLKWHNKYFGHIEIIENPERRYETPKVLIDDRLPAQQGSGSRAILSILVRIFDNRLKVLLIDEPEISLEPKTQKKLMFLFQLASQGKEGLPQKKIFISTHSHLFIDREDFRNNSIVQKKDDQTTIRKVQNEKELQEIVFSLLGSSPEDLFFPSNIIVVEGASDAIFLQKVSNFIGDMNKNIAIHFAEGDSKVPIAAEAIEQMLKTSSYIPVYKDKICVLLDGKRDSSFVNKAKEILKDEGERVIQLSKEAIEYFYPKRILKKITGLDETNIDKEIKSFLCQVNKNKETWAGQLGRFNGTKVNLAKMVTELMEISDLEDVSLEIRKLLSVAINKCF